MFEPKRFSSSLVNYIGARVTDAEEAWLRSEMRRRALTMSDLIRVALSKLQSTKAEIPRTVFTDFVAKVYDILHEIGNAQPRGSSDIGTMLKRVEDAVKRVYERS
jgi:hypothetical protein